METTGNNKIFAQYFVQYVYEHRTSSIDIKLRHGSVERFKMQLEKNGQKLLNIFCKMNVWLESQVRGLMLG